MIYGEKVRFARKKLGMDRDGFAELLEMSEKSIANVENCKDETIKLSFDRMKLIIDKTKLPKGFFFYDPHEVMAYILDDAEVYTRGGTITDDEAKDIIGVAGRIK